MPQFSTIDAELTWYFNHYAASINFSSGYGTLIQQAFGFHNQSTDYEPTDAILHNTARARKIYARLANLEAIHHKCLQMTYDNEARLPFPFPVDITVIFGNKVGALLALNLITVKDLETLCKKVRRRNMKPTDEKLIFNLRDKSSTLYIAAHQAYLETNVV